ncbi:MAG: hypothetical protein CENE_02179 [Candidatus Celerinatantimonas neptuna]|nr:MAG: hypothetical protein CENE_02179 [Candidatus Celerinatantimonas neptuna]
MRNLKQQGVVLLMILSIIILLMEGCLVLTQMCELDLHSTQIALKNHHDWMVLQHHSFDQIRLLVQGKSVVKGEMVSFRVKPICKAQCWKNNTECQLVDLIARYHHKFLELGFLKPAGTSHIVLTDCPVTHFAATQGALLWLHRRYESF